MPTDITGNSIFGRLKNVFSNTEPTDQTITPATLEQEHTIQNSRNQPEEQSIQPVETEGLIEREIAVRTVEVTAPHVILPDEKDLDIHFATSFIQSGGKFIFCESIRDAVENLRMLKLDQGWSHIFCWENEIRDAFGDHNFQKGAIGFTIENSDAAISLCETLIASEGTIILNPKQASRRRLPCFPKAHIIFTDVAHLAAGEAEGLETFYKKHKGELPSIIKLGNCNNGHFYDKQRLILNAEGPENVYVFLIDELIPYSLRP